MDKANGGRRRNQNLMGKCALAVAAGSSVSQWAKANEIPVRTTYGWSRTTEFKSLVASHRQRIVDRAVGKLTKHAQRLSTRSRNFVKSGETDAIKLNAAKAVISTLIEIESHSMTMRTLSDLASRIDSLEKHTDATREPI